MEEGKSRLTLPEMVKVLSITRATAERLVSQYAEQLPTCERAGIIRTWPAGTIEDLRRLLAEEERIRRGNQWNTI